MITDTDFADDIALISDNLDKAQSLLEGVETAATEVALHINTGKNKTHGLQPPTQGDLTTLDNSKVGQVDDFKYLDSWIDQTKKDFEIRKGKAWAASNKLINLNRDLKIRFFRVSFQSVLLYGSESLTLTTTLEEQIDGCYTRLLRAALNISWKDHISNDELYWDLPPTSASLQIRRLHSLVQCLIQTLR